MGVVILIDCDLCRDTIAGERTEGAARRMALNMGAESRDGKDVCSSCRRAEDDERRATS